MYIRYQLDQITRQLKNYQELCNIFFELANDSETRVTLEEILYQGTYKGFNFYTELCNKDNPFLEGKRRISMAYLLIRNPETFYFLVQNKINLFHGTNANALPTILKYGLNSIEKAEEKGIQITTGETWSRGIEVRNFISFSDILSVAEYYSDIKPTNVEERFSFGIIIGTSVDEANQCRMCHVLSETPEIGIRDEFPLENIKVLCVPTDRLNFVRKIVSNLPIKVLSMDDSEKKFYYIDDMGIIFIYPEILEELKVNLSKNRNKKFFRLNEIKHIALGRAITNIKNKINQIKTIMSEEKDKRLW